MSLEYEGIWGGSRRRQSMRRHPPLDEPLVNPRIPTGRHPGPNLGNRAFQTAQQARQAAKAAARELDATDGPGHRVIHEYRHAPGQLPHFHVVNPQGERVSGHFFYGRLPYPTPRRLPWHRRMKRWLQQREMEHSPTHSSSGELELRRLLRQVDRMVKAEREGETSGYRPNPFIANVCRRANHRAIQLREEMRVAQALREPSSRAQAIRILRGRANYFIRRWANQAIGLLPRMHRRDIDILVGCLARLEHAAGASLPAMNPLRQAAQRALAGRFAP